MTQVNITIGRLQPFTLGHLKCVEGPYKDRGFKTVIAMIDTPDSKVDSRHPFPSSMLLPLYRKAFKHNPMIVDIVLVKNADIVKIADAVREAGDYEIASWSCGTDRIDSYTKMSDKYKEQAGLAPDFEMYEVKRGDEDISATKVRAALKADDKKEYERMVPKDLWHSYKELQGQLNKVVKEGLVSLSDYIKESILDVDKTMSSMKEFAEINKYITAVRGDIQKWLANNGWVKYEKKNNPTDYKEIIKDLDYIEGECQVSTDFYTMLQTALGKNTDNYNPYEPPTSWKEFAKNIEKELEQVELSFNPAFEMGALDGIEDYKNCCMITWTEATKKKMPKELEEVLES